MKRSPIRKVSPKNKTRVGKLGIVRLRGEDLEKLRSECFDRDKGRCQWATGPDEICGKSLIYEAGYSDSMHMAHRKGKRNHGDTLENVRALCAKHHADEHNPKSVPKK